MKRIYLSTIFTLLFAALFAQSIEITDHNSNVVNFGDTVKYFSSDLNKFPHTLEFTAKNTNTVDSNSYKVRQMAISEVPSTLHYFCFGSCFSPGINLSPTGVWIVAGESIATGAFTTDYAAQGHEGTTIIAYSVFDENNPADSTYFIVKYYVAVDASISSTTSSVTISDAYPNPAKDFFFVDYEINNAQMANIEVVNILGSVVFNQEISTNDSRAKINISELKSGVYFYNVIVDGNRLASKKLIIR